jgi:hypothetical protein
VVLDKHRRVDDDQFPQAIGCVVWLTGLLHRARALMMTSVPAPVHEQVQQRAGGQQ